MKRQLYIIICFFYYLLATYNIVWTQQSAEISKVRIGYIELTSNLPLFVALEKGYFKEEGLEIELIKAANSGEAINALTSEKIDTSIGNSYSILFAVEQRSPGLIKMYLPCSESEKHFVSYLLVKKNSLIKSVKQLKGKKIGTYTGPTQLLFLKLFLKRINFDPEKDVTIIQVDPSMQLPALKAGQYDALFTIDPYPTIAINNGIAKPLIKFPRKYILNPFPAGANSFSNKFLKENPEGAKKVYRALEKAIDFIRKNEKKAKKYLSKYTPIEESLTLKSDIYEWSKDINISSVQQLSDLFVEYKILEKKIDVKNMFIYKKDLK